MKRLEDQKENFMSILTHDLKTPILAQKQSLELLLVGAFGELNSEQKDILQLTKESCDTVLDMVSTILANYKFENNEIYLDYEQVNVKEIVHEACVELNEQIKEKDLRLEILSSISQVFVRADRKLLKQALYNIITNSISYAYSDSIFLIRIDNTELNTCISVINKGRQLSDNMIDNMFDYYACNSSKHTKIGFGIKLYLAMQIVKAHSGGIVVRNNKRDEIVFEIVLPFCNKNSPVIKLNNSVGLSKNLSA